MRASLSIVTLNTSAPVEGVQAKKKEEAMSHDAVGPRGPAPLAKDINARKPMKYLGTLLSTETEEVSDGNGTNKRLTKVRRSVRR